MRRLMFFVGGAVCGAVIGASLALLLTPASGDALRDGVKIRVEEAKTAGQLAANQRRRELEAQLAEMTSPSSSSKALKRY
jgi:gas vesicle protein